MTIAPAGMLPANAATKSAEYSKPQGSSAHITPNAIAAPVPCAVVKARTSAHTLRPAPSSHIGCRAWTNNINPNKAAAT
jgi:hypothetical protein